MLLPVTLGRNALNLRPTLDLLHISTQKLTVAMLTTPQHLDLVTVWFGGGTTKAVKGSRDVKFSVLLLLLHLAT